MPTVLERIGIAAVVVNLFRDLQADAIQVGEPRERIGIERDGYVVQSRGSSVGELDREGAGLVRGASSGGDPRAEIEGVPGGGAIELGAHDRDGIRAIIGSGNNVK